jgi:hypothetical protein
MLGTEHGDFHAILDMEREKERERDIYIYIFKVALCNKLATGFHWRGIISICSCLVTYLV